MHIHRIKIHRIKSFLNFLKSSKFKFLRLSYSPYVDYVHLYLGAALKLDFFGDETFQILYTDVYIFLNASNMGDLSSILCDGGGREMEIL